MVTTQFTRTGFSLIEVLVSLSIFTVVITIAVGSLLALIGANARVQNSQAIMTNLSYALDSMTREIRTGDTYYCGDASALPTSGDATRDCSNGGAALSFSEGGSSLTQGASSDKIAYRQNGSTIERRIGSGSWLPVTAPEVRVEYFRFFVTGSTRGDDTTPSVTVHISGVTGSSEDEEAADFFIQTTVAQQLLDI